MSQNTQEQCLDHLLAHPASSALALASRGTACHLVGGTLRDTLLDLPCRDFDAVVEQNGAQVAETLSTALGARLVHLGRDRFAAYRIVGPEITVDLWDRQNQPLDKDLARRDLTINSMALDLIDRRLVDPFGGLHDLAEHRLRATSQQAFASDPLRVLRLARFAGQLPDFAVEGQSLELARLAATGLSDVAPERIREELRLALEGESVHATIRLFVELGVYPGLWTQWTMSDRVAVDAELLATFERLEHLPAVLPPRVTEQIDRYLTRTALLLDHLAQLSGTPADELLTQCHEEGYLTKREARDIRVLLDWGELPEPREERRWLLHITGRFWPSGVAYYGARIRESAAAATWPKILGDFLELIDRSGDEIFEPTPFLTGRDIQRILHIPPGPAIGELVELLKRVQIEGRIGNRKEAEAYLVQNARAGPRADGTPGLQKDHQPGPRQEGLEIKRSPSSSPPDAD